MQEQLEGAYDWLEGVWHYFIMDSGFVEALVKSLGMIAASEIGDKTFFIAAVMAMRNPRWTVFSGALGALAVMTVLSAILGRAAPYLIPKVYTHYAATALFFFFGAKTLYDVFFGEEEEGESELEQVEHELAAQPMLRSSKDRDLQELGGLRGENGKKDAARPGGAAAAQALGTLEVAARMLFSPIFLKAFTLTFLAEWGDRSQIATIGLAAAYDVVGVIVGSIVGHAACTGAAVLGGRHLAAHINERTVGIVGGIMFILFGLHGLYVGPS